MSAQYPAVHIDVSFAGGTTPFRHSWKECFGSGHAQLGTRVDWRAQLVQAKNDLGLRGIRMHGWLDDDMSVAPTARPPFFFYNLDLVADHLVSLDISPVFELSYMPRSMANCTAAQACYSAFHNRGGYKGLVEPPSDYALWYGLVRELGQHLVARYGIETLLEWRFECWNEPNSWVGGEPANASILRRGKGSCRRPPSRTQTAGVDYPAQYRPLFNASSKALKAVDPRLKIGGPASVELAHLADFAAWTARSGVVSSHVMKCRERLRESLRRACPPPCRVAMPGPCMHAHLHVVWRCPHCAVASSRRNSTSSRRTSTHPTTPARSRVSRTAMSSTASCTPSSMLARP